MKQNLLVILLLALCAPHAFAQGPAKGAIEAFASRTGALPTIDKATNSLGFLRFPNDRPYQVAGGDAVQKSMNFISENKALFGLRANQDEYRLRKQEADIYGLENITLQQTYKGVPVYDGLMKFHYNRGRALASLNGNYISDIKVNVSPTLAQHEAESRAIRQVKAQYADAAEAAEAVRSTLCIFQKGLVQGFNGAKLLVYEVEVRNNAGIREFVFVDAHSGLVVEQFTGTHRINRLLYEGSTANLVWSEGNAFPGTLDKWQQSEVQTAGFIYNLMNNIFGHTSYDDADAPMLTINNNTSFPCPNAGWDGTTTMYCSGIATDDVVAHEWAHAYTQYTSGLVYGWQPGALNEAYSDIWGETVDLLNGYMDSGESNTARTGCGSSDRWIMGEKIEAAGAPRRDLWNPTCFGQPGKVSDPQYWCSTDDYGGVHTNSGVLNHAYALLVDGGSYNGQTITGIGLTKAAHIFWRAQATYMTATTDFSAQADILEASAAGLLGVNLPQLSTAAVPPAGTPEVITNADLVSLSKVIAAVELRENNSCQFYTVLKPAPALCEGANQGLAIFYENFETGLGGFTTAEVPGDASDWVSRSWQPSNAPAGRTGKVAYAIDYNGGDCENNFQQGLIRMESPVITIPANTAGNLSMAFDHYVVTEDTWDGGNIKYRINGGAWALLPASAFTANPYNNFLTYAAAGNTNPLAGERAFTGYDQGSVTGGSWGQSQVNLSSLGLVAGNTIQFRFEFGTDGCGGLDGWYVDDFRVYSCAVTPAVHFTTTSAVINENQATTAGAGCLDYIDRTVTVQIDKAPTQPVTVTFNTPAGSAKQGADYTISPASVTLSGGSLTQNVTVRIFNDAYVEGEETIDLSYSINANGGNGFTATGFQNFRFTILDDDLAPGNYTETLLNSDFNNGAPGWSVVNGGNSFHSWELVQYSNAGLDAAKSPFYFVNSDIQDGQLYYFDEYLESPPVNASGKKNLVLTFSQDWRPYIDANNEQGVVEVWDGSAWQVLLTQNQATGRKGNIGTFTPNVVNLPIPNAYANPNMKVRFRYAGHWEYWWAIDDVKVTASNSTQVMSAVNTGNAAQEYLGPNETAVFYDPATGNLMAKIRNLSAHDYGCTTVEVDRSGANATSWLGGFQISNKTYKVTPTHNNPTGQYEITLYYKGSELSTFTPPNILSMGKSAGSIATGEPATTTTAAVSSSPAFSGDYAFTSTFNTGFSGFGLSSAPPGSALPVTLVHFDGKNTSEGNVLEWTTSSETNNDYFAIEESTNGKKFFETGRVKGAGNASAANHYDFTDVDFHKGITYYRLKQVDFDGKYAYSRIVAVDAPSAGNIRFYPNPVQSALTVELPNLQGSRVDARVTDAAGREVIVRENAVVQNGRVNIQLGKLPAGIYQVLITNDNVNYRLSVFKP